MTERVKFLLLLIATGCFSMAILSVSFWIYRAWTFDDRVYRELVGGTIGRDEVLDFTGDDLWFNGYLGIVIKDNSQTWERISRGLKQYTKPFKPPPLLLEHIGDTSIKTIHYYKLPRNPNSTWDDTKRVYYAPTEKIMYVGRQGYWD